jgi:hypothetical protein
MKSTERPLPLKNAPLQYAPENELGVVFLFSQIAKRLQFRIEKIRAAYPDCIAYRHAGDREKRVMIEFEYRSSSFRAHGHDATKCDCIVCWHHDWTGVPSHLEVIELKRYFGTPFKVWLQVAIKDQCDQLEGSRKNLEWALSPRVTHGDLLLMYRASPSCQIADVFRYVGHGLERGGAVWRSGEADFGSIRRICRLESPIFLSDLRRHRVLRTATFMRVNFQGRGHLISEYWPYLHSMIHDRNPATRKLLARYAPGKFD